MHEENNVDLVTAHIQNLTASKINPMTIKVKLSSYIYSKKDDEYKGLYNNEWITLENLPQIIREGDHEGTGKFTRDELEKKIRRYANTGILTDTFTISQTCDKSGNIYHPILVEFHCEEENKNGPDLSETSDVQNFEGLPEITQTSESTRPRPSE